MPEIVEMSNGFRAWGAAALLFGFPALWAFLRYAWRRAFAACRGVEGHLHCLVAFLAGLWRAGEETNLRVNAWVSMGTLLFAGAAGAAIFLASNFLGGYTGAPLTLFMLPMWALLAAAAWGVTIQTALHRQRIKFALASGILLVAMMALALAMDGRA